MAWFYEYKDGSFMENQYEGGNSLGEREVKIKPLYVGLCGSDIYRLNHGIQSPSIGHEWIGEVLESVSSSYKPGNIVTSSAHISCGDCSLCEQSNYSLCRNKKLLGGSPERSVLSEEITLKDDFLFLISNEEKSQKEIRKYALLEVAYIGDLAFNEAKRIGLESGDKVLVFGAGAVGLFTAWGLKLKGWNPIIVDPVISRVERCKELGLEAMTFSEIIIKGQHFLKFNLVIDCSGDAHGKGALDYITKFTAPFGKAVIVGKYKDRVLNQSSFADLSLTVTWVANHPLEQFKESIEFWREHVANCPEDWQTFYPREKINESFEEAKALNQLKCTLSMVDK